MKSLVSILAILTVVLVGCGKDKKDNNNSNINYDPYSYNNGYPYNGNCYAGGAGGGFYQWQGNLCVDIRRPGVSVHERYCNNSMNSGFNNNCNNFGNGWSSGGSWSGSYSSNWNYQVVSGFGTSVCAPGFTPVPMYGFNNQIMCVESGFIPFVTANYGMPSQMYSGYGFGAVGCIPGYSSCSCQQVGGGLRLGVQFGNAYAGLSAGICF